MRAIFFDLDYTLYDQREYLLGSLGDVACAVADHCGRDRDGLRRSLRAVWEKEGTDCVDLFDRWLRLEGLLEPDHVRLCVETFHAHAPPTLEPYPSTRRVLQALRVSHRVGIITDGHRRMQRSKIAALGLEESVDRIFLPHERGMRKPDPRIYRMVADEEGLEPHEVLYVGDHPIKDIMAASQAGLATVRVLTGEFSSLPDHPGHSPTHTIADLSQLLAVIASIRDPQVTA